MISVLVSLVWIPVQVRVRPGARGVYQILVFVERKLPVLEVLVELICCVTHSLSVHVSERRKLS